MTKLIIDLNQETNLEVNRIKRLLSISYQTSDVLATYVVIYRSLFIDKELAVACMQELSRRRELGENFAYEEFIEEKLKEIPQTKNLNLVDMKKNMSLLSLFKGKK